MAISSTYTLDFSITDGQNTCETRKPYYIMPPSFLDFWVWSMNKINTDPSDVKCFGGGKAVCGMTTIIVFFTTGVVIPESKVLNAAGQTTSICRFIVSFENNIDDVFVNGFEADLGTSKS